MQYGFQGQIELISSTEVVANVWRVYCTFKDYAGAYSGLDVSVGDYIYLNTDNFALGTFSRYEITNVDSKQNGGFTIIIEGEVDPAYGLNFFGIAARVTPKLTLNTGSFQNVDNKLVAFVYNDNFDRLDFETYPYAIHIVTGKQIGRAHV